MVKAHAIPADEIMLLLIAKRVLQEALIILDRSDHRSCDTGIEVLIALGFKLLL